MIREFSEKIGSIALTENGGIIVASLGQNGEGKFYKVSQNGKLYTIDLDGDVKYPAKFWLDTQSIWILDSLNNRIQKITPE